MLNMCLLSIIIVLCVIGIRCVVKEIVRLIFKNDIKSYVVLEINNNNAAGAEGTLRSVLNANPKSEVIVMDKSGNREIAKILGKLSLDIERLHIKTAPEK